MKPENISTIAFTILGIIIGYVSFLLSNNYLSLAVAVIFLYVGAQLFKRIFKINEKLNWFWTNGGWIYLFMWFIVWIVFYNL